MCKGELKPFIPYGNKTDGKIDINASYDNISFDLIKRTGLQIVNNTKYGLDIHTDDDFYRVKHDCINLGCSNDIAIGVVKLSLDKSITNGGTSLDDLLVKSDTLSKLIDDKDVLSGTVEKFDACLEKIESLNSIGKRLIESNGNSEFACNEMSIYLGEVVRVRGDLYKAYQSYSDYVDSYKAENQAGISKEQYIKECLGNGIEIYNSSLDKTNPDMYEINELHIGEKGFVYDGRGAEATNRCPTDDNRTCSEQNPQYIAWYAHSGKVNFPDVGESITKGRITLSDEEIEATADSIVAMSVMSAESVKYLVDNGMLREDAVNEVEGIRSKHFDIPEGVELSPEEKIEEIKAYTDEMKELMHRYDKEDDKDMVVSDDKNKVSVKDRAKVAYEDITAKLDIQNKKMGVLAHGDVFILGLSAAQAITGLVSGEVKYKYNMPNGDEKVGLYSTADALVSMYKILTASPNAIIVSVIYRVLDNVCSRTIDIAVRNLASGEIENTKNDTETTNGNMIEVDPENGVFEALPDMEIEEIVETDTGIISDMDDEDADETHDFNDSNTDDCMDDTEYVPDEETLNDITEDIEELDYTAGYDIESDLSDNTEQDIVDRTDYFNDEAETDGFGNEFLGDDDTSDYDNIDLSEETVVSFEELDEYKEFIDKPEELDSQNEQHEVEDVDNNTVQDTDNVADEVSDESDGTDMAYIDSTDDITDTDSVDNNDTISDKQDIVEDEMTEQFTSQSVEMDNNEELTDFRLNPQNELTDIDKENLADKINNVLDGIQTMEEAKFSDFLNINPVETMEVVSDTLSEKLNGCIEDGADIDEAAESVADFITNITNPSNYDTFGSSLENLAVSVTKKSKNEDANEKLYSALEVLADNTTINSESDSFSSDELDNSDDRSLSFEMDGHRIDVDTYNTDNGMERVITVDFVEAPKSEMDMAIDNTEQAVSEKIEPIVRAYADGQPIDQCIDDYIALDDSIVTKEDLLNALESVRDALPAVVSLLDIAASDDPTQRINDMALSSIKNEVADIVNDIIKDVTSTDIKGAVDGLKQDIADIIKDKINEMFNESNISTDSITNDFNSSPDNSFVDTELNGVDMAQGGEMEAMTEGAIEASGAMADGVGAAEAVETVAAVL